MTNGVNPAPVPLMFQNMIKSISFGILLILSCIPGKAGPSPAPDATPETSGVVSTTDKVKTMDDLIAALAAGADGELIRQRWDEIRTPADVVASNKFHEGFAALYLQQVKKSIIDHAKHGGWPYRTFLIQDKTLRKHLTKALEMELEVRPSPIVKYAMICPTLYADDKMKALDLIDQLKKEDQFLYERASQNMFTYWIPFIDRQLKSEKDPAPPSDPQPTN